MAFVFMIIQVKTIDTTSWVTAMGGLHSNFFMGIANVDSLPTATMILTISLSLPYHNIKELGFYFAKLR